MLYKYSKKLHVAFTVVNAPKNTNALLRKQHILNIIESDAVDNINVVVQIC